jgi:hypothetical protein
VALRDVADEGAEGVGAVRLHRPHRQLDVELASLAVERVISMRRLRMPGERLARKRSMPRWCASRWRSGTMRSVMTRPTASCLGQPNMRSAVGSSR